MFYNIPVAGTGNSGVVMVDYRQRPFGVTARVIVPSTETATYSVYESLDNPDNQVPCTLARTTTTAAQKLLGPKGPARPPVQTWIRG